MAYSIPDQIVSAIGSMYHNTEAKVCSPDGVTVFFVIHAGVLQGNALALFLLIIALDYAMRSAIEGLDLHWLREVIAFQRLRSLTQTLLTISH